MADEPRRVLSVDADTLPKHFDSAAAEKRWDAAWQESGLYHYDPARPRAESFVVDTPPPTASGSLHPGHMFSYTHTDICVRFHRMRGQNVFYPMGWDDNGLATERRVQNYLHVRCDPTAPYEPGLRLEPPDAKRRKEAPPRNISRPNFIEACFDVTREDEKSYKELWRRLGISVDWRQEYQTIDDHCRRVAQLSFRELFERGEAYTSEAPTMWDVDFQTAVAQAEVKDVSLSGAFHDLEFAVEGGGRFVISTTRPELLAACVGVTAHPSDERYRAFFGKRAVTPLFRVPVPIFPSELADPEKGTGILMVCTFGDATDVLWWRDQRLALRQLVGRNGRLLPVEFGSEGFESRDPEAANRFYAELAGKPVAGARKAIVPLLRRPEGSATGSGPPLQGEPRPLDHTVKFYEKGDRPLEFVSTRQWFVRLLDKKPALLAKGAEIAWHPPYMGKRYADWTENLSHDWGISRQRYFGVPIPVWYPLDGDGHPLYERPLVAERAQLPIDPTQGVPAGYQEAQRGKPGGFVADTDVFDTWFTSSMTPQISSHWGTDAKRHAALFPADLRPQAHDIIRTWAFYTIAKAMLHEDQVPWRHAAISGFVLDPDRKKMSKSVGNVVTPVPLVDQYGADAIRYWAGCARLGVDTAIDENVFKVGKRLATKLFNAGKFVLGQTAELRPITEELDRAFAAELRALAERATAHFEGFDEAHALAETESFFWGRFTDTYLELAKTRARGEDADARGSAVAGLRLGLSVLLRLLAPFQPYITEEVWSWAFAKETGQASIHRAPWPGPSDFAGVAAPADPGRLQLAIDALATIHKAKADGAVSAGREVTRLVLAAEPATLRRTQPALGDVLAAARCGAHRLVPRVGIAAGGFVVDEIEFAERPVT